MKRFELINLETGDRVEIATSLVIGRREGDLLVDDPEMSRRHAQITVDGGELAIIDLGSRNGTFVDEEMITGERFLIDQQVVRLGQSRWRVEALGFAASDTTAVSSPQDATRAAQPAPPAPSTAEPRAFPAPAFEAPPRQRASAARSGVATLVCYALVAANAIALAIYFASR
jgi:hypothetical protein